MSRFVSKNKKTDSGVNYLYSSGTDDVLAAKNSKNSITLYSKNDSKTPQLSNIVRERNLIGHWKLNEGTGTSVADSSGSGNTGTMTNASWENGRKGKCIDFDGTDDYIDCGTCGDLFKFTQTTAYSLSCWIKTDTNGRRTLFSYMDINQDYEGWDMYLVPTGVIRMHLIDSNSSNKHIHDTTLTVDDGNWHHICGVYDGSNTGTDPHGFKIYIDGVPDTLTNTDAGTVNLSTGDYTTQRFLIGSRSHGSGSGSYGNDLQAKLSDVRVYNVALTAEEIYKLYKAEAIDLGIDTETGTIEDNLVGWWKLNEGIGIKAFDSSLNDNVGTLTGDTVIIHHLRLG